MSDIYFAGGFMNDPNNPEGEKVFQIVKPSGDGELPYLTLSPRGLRSTAHHANIYRLSTDGKKAVLADLRCLNGGGAGTVKLTESQQAVLRKAIEANRFYE